MRHGAMIRTRTWMGAGAFLLAAISAAQLDPNRVVATVNGEAIKGAEYYHRMEFLSGVGKQMGDGVVESPPGFLTILQLVGERLVLQLAKEKGVSPTQAEIDAELKMRLEDDPKLIEKWASTGQSEADLKSQIKFEMARFKLQTFGVTITDQEVDKFYKDNPGRFTTPKKAKLRVIAVESEEGRKVVDADLAAGKSFEDVAKQHSKDITSSIGGALGTIPINYLPENVRTIINATKIGQKSAWVSANNRHVKYEVVDLIPQQVQPMTPRLRIATRRSIMLDRGRTKNDLAREINAMRSKSKVTIAQKEFAELYKKVVDSSAPAASK